MTAVVTPIATLVLAGVAILTFRQNRALVGSANRQAEASARQAEGAATVVEEMRLDRELAYRPHLFVEYEHDDVGIETIVVRNVGRGPALRCRFVQHRYLAEPPVPSDAGHAWRTFELPAVGPGEERRLQGTRFPFGNTLEYTRHIKIVDTVPRYDGSADFAAWAYEDEFGTSYRYPRSRWEMVPEVHRRREPAPAPWD